MNKPREFTPSEELLLDLYLESLEHMSEEDVETELRLMGGDPNQVPSWRGEVLESLAAKMTASAHNKSQALPMENFSANVIEFPAVSSGRARHEARPLFVSVDIGEAHDSTQLRAAASHRVGKGLPRRQFTLVWKQGDDQWTMEGVGDEVELTSDCDTQPDFIEWNNSVTGQADRLTLRRSTEGRILVNIFPSKALLRAESINDAVDEARRGEMLPVVHVARELS